MPGINIGNIYFITELLTAELIFLYPVPKRSKPWLRLPLCLAAVVVFAALLPRNTNTNLRETYNLFRFFSQFIVSVGAMALCFQLPAETLFSMCVAGYAVQHLAFKVAALAAMIPILPELGNSVTTRSRIFEVIIMAAIYLVVLLTLGKFSAKNECYRNRDKRFTRLSVLTILICVGFSRVAGLLGEPRTSVSSSVYSILCCLLALYIQFNLHVQSLMEREKAALDRAHQEEKKRYEIAKDLMESVNIKVHDFKHRLQAYDGKLAQDEIAGLKEDMDLYDMNLITDCEAINVVLGDRMLRCRAMGIRFTISGDWSRLSFIKATDIYIFFGNALDNAVEAVSRLTDMDKRIIDLSVETRGDLHSVRCCNYFTGALVMEEGVPKTIKETEIGYHGYGIKSMKLIAEKYNGDLSITTQDDLFILNAYFSEK